MSRLTRNLDRMLTRIDGMAYGPEERALIDEVIALADEAGDTVRGFSARIKLISSANHLGDTESMLTAFAWCLGMHDRNPKAFPLVGGPGDGNLLWLYKWMIPRLASSPIFPRSQVEGAIDDMQSRYDAAKAGRSGVLTASFVASWSLGDPKKSDRLHTELLKAPRDEYSDCAACVAAQHVSHLIARGSDAEAAAAVDEMLDDGLQCNEQPQNAVSNTLVSFLTSGQPDRALALHFPSYRAVRDNPDNLSMVGSHVLFLALSGNLQRGLELVERHLSWLTWDPLFAKGQFDTLLAFAVLLDDVVRAGGGDGRVRAASSTELTELLGTPVEELTVETLALACWRTAERIGLRFDQRNGTDAFAREVARHRALVGVRHEALLAPDTPVLPDPAPPLAEPSTAAEWFFFGREKWVRDDNVGAREAVDAGLAVATELMRARLLLTSARLYFADGRVDEAHAALAERHEIYEAHGRGAIAQIERDNAENWLSITALDDLSPFVTLHESGTVTDTLARGVLASIVAVHYRATGQLDTAIGLARGGYETHLALREEHSAARDLIVLAQAYTMQENGAEALAAVALIDDLQTDRLVRAEALIVRSRVALTQHDSAGGLEHANAALATFLSAGVRSNIAEAAMLSADALGELGRFGEAVARTQLALRQAELGELDERPMIRQMLAMRFNQAGRPDEALELLVDQYNRRDELGLTPPHLGEILYFTGQSLAMIGNVDAAVGAWTDAAANFVAAGEPERAAGCEFEAAQAQLDADHPAEAITLLTSATAHLRSIPEPNVQLSADVSLSLGLARARTGDRDGMTDIANGLASMRATEEPWLIGRALRASSLAHLALGNLSDALADSLRAADSYEESGDVHGAAASERSAAHILSEESRFSEAEPILRAALERVAPGDHLYAALTFELADVLEKLDRAAEASDLRKTLGYE